MNKKPAVVPMVSPDKKKKRAAEDKEGAVTVKKTVG